MKIFSLSDEQERKEAEKTVLALIHKSQDHHTELDQMAHPRLVEAKELIARFNQGHGCSDRVLAYGSSEKFVERKTLPSPVKDDETYDLEGGISDLQRENYTVIGGLGGFSLANGAKAAELIMLPPGDAVRAGLENGKHVASVVPPLNIYPMAVLTGRKFSRQGEHAFICLFEPGDLISQPMKELAAKVNDSKKTLTGTITGNFSDITGYVFTKASPQTVLVEFNEREQRNLFVYQTLLGDNVPGFERTLHSHGYESGKLGSHASFGAHLHDAKVHSFALGIFAVAREVVTLHR